MRIVVAAAAGLFVAASPSWSADIKERTTYFSVSGSTLADLDRDLLRRGPLVSTTGARHAGATEVTFDGHVTYLPGKKSCRIGKPDVSLKLVTTVPKWRASKKASSETALFWGVFQADVVRHEARHAAIAKQWLAKLERRIKSLPAESTCDAMKRKVEAVSRKTLAEHERAQLAFDKREAREIPRRLERAIRQKARRLAAR